ncbi:2-oxo-3-hexenedioate decarboxylase [Kerstersia gyiorum]|uniref:2-oxo-3-hexenedioate decarboxylase n=1 Tax=Kerstersia gyiorum TaxID=206506 RepID=UPI0020A0C184|nr:2-oxo-3-hexenedioate decarboxylase [Kerstersia gyiorum]MCP1711728.1 2-oxo-3-hexenedioate decarboxylase [Kerstersia gyiorum]
MTLDASTREALAQQLDHAERERRPIPRITDAQPLMDWDDAYAIQDLLRARKQARGIAVSGLKMGLTSQAKMQQMGVTEPIHGFITADGAIANGGDIRMDELIHPKIEAEIAFIPQRPLTGPGIHAGDVLAATACILPAVEIIDSRYENFRFDLKSVIADNTSAARYVTGDTIRPAQDLDLRHLGVVLERNGRLLATAAGAAVLGNPINSVAMLANMLGRQGRSLPAGQLILTGGITEAFQVSRGDHIRVRYEHLGEVSMHFI